MANYSDDENDFESFSDEEINDDFPFDDDHEGDDGNPIAVNVTSRNGGNLPALGTADTYAHDGCSSVIAEESDNELELHGKGDRMKLSKKPPEVLLRQYQQQIATSLQNGNYQLAIEDLIRCTALSRIIYGDSHWRFAKSEAELAYAYWRYRSMAPQAQQHAEEARNIMLRVVQTGEAQEDRQHIYRTLLSVYVTLGEAYNAQQKFTDAELCYQKAEKILSEQKKQKKSLSGDEQERDQELKCDLRIAQGKLAANQSKAASAIAHFEDAISLIQAEYGDDSVKLITLYQMVGRVEQSREGANHIKSIDAYLQAHSIANANYSEGTEELAETGYQLALAYARAASTDSDAETSAESYLNECLAAYQSIHGPNHEKTLKCQDELARLMIRTDRAEEAIELLRSTLPAKRQTFGEHSQSLASTYKLLGSVHMSQGNMEKALKSMNKELGEAEQQYRSLQQQHLTQLQVALDDKDKQIADGKTLFEQLKNDFKYNLRLLQERDEELEQNDITIAQLRDQLNHQLQNASELSIRVHELSDKCGNIEEDCASKEDSFRKQLHSERLECDARLKSKMEELSKHRLEWESERRALDEKLKIVEEMRVREKREAQVLFDDQLSQLENEWKARIETIESDLLVHQLRVSSLTNETEKLREDRLVTGEVVNCSEAAQRSLENELKQSKWELNDYRALCTRRIQDLESQIAFTEQSQKSLVEKYERKLVQSEARLQEVTEHAEKVSCDHNDRVSSLNVIIQTLKSTLSDKETELARMQWKLEDLAKEKTKIIEENAVSSNKLHEEIKNLKANDNGHILQEEINHLKKCLDEVSNDLSLRAKDVEKYQAELAVANDQLLEAERQRARMELDCQRQCEQIKREQYDKSEKLIGRLSQAKDHAEATIKRLEKESMLQQKAIGALKRDRNDAYDTLRAHGLTVEVSKSSSVVSPRDLQEVKSLELLQVQNEGLKKVISQMRNEMEHIAIQKPNDFARSSGRPDDVYVKSLEDEIKELKQQLRHAERNVTKPSFSSQDLVDAVNSGDDTALKELISSMNSMVSSLRAEKVELTANGRKQQVEIESLKLELKQMRQLPKDMQVELEQAKYELNSVSRKRESEVGSFKQRTSELETQLESCREEGAEYHKNLLTANAELEYVSTELATLKMQQARSGNVINYGAQELVIQNLQDENERLRNMIKDKTGDQSKGGELSRALSRISQLNKEKIVLTELSNRLRSELSAAGIQLNRPSASDHHTHKPPSNSRVSQAVTNKLDQLEKMQYEYMKTNIAKSSQFPTAMHANKAVKNTASPPTKQGRMGPVQRRHGTQARSIPDVIEQSSASGSSFKAKGKPVVLQSSRPKPMQLYVAPPPNGKLKSNVAWVKERKSLNDKDRVSSEQAVGDPNSAIQSPEQGEVSRSHPGVLDSMELGSSIQEVWKLLDEQPSLNSTTPD